MIRLFRDPTDPTQWFAYSGPTGWVRFPPKINGWNERRPSARPPHSCEVPIHLAFNTGMLESWKSWDAAA